MLPSPITCWKEGNALLGVHTLDPNFLHPFCTLIQLSSQNAQPTSSLKVSTLVIKVKTRVGKCGIWVLESPCPGEWEGGEMETGIADMSTHVP